MSETQELTAVLESLLFASTEPLTVQEIEAALPSLTRKQIEEQVDELSKRLSDDNRGLQIQKVAGGWRLVTKPALIGPLRALFRFRNKKRLTPATLDVLAIIAYAQPVTGPEIQEIRGTDPSYALRVLLDRRLVRMVGRKKVVGRPILYGTTREFLLHFGLDRIQDLPPVEGYGTQVSVEAPMPTLPLGDDEIEPLDGDESAESVAASVPPADAPADERPSATPG